MEQIDLSRAKAACIDVAIQAFCAAILLGLVGALIQRLSPDSVEYWHPASLTAIALIVAWRSVALARDALGLAGNPD